MESSAALDIVARALDATTMPISRAAIRGHETTSGHKQRTCHADDSNSSSEVHAGADK